MLLTNKLFNPNALFLYLLLFFSPVLLTGCFRGSESDNSTDEWSDQTDSLSVFAPAIEGLKPRNEPSGLLLSVAFSDPENDLAPTRYRTFFLKLGEGKAKIQQTFPYLTIPYESKFVYAGQILADTAQDCNLKLGRSASMSKKYEQIWISRNKNDSSLFQSKLKARMKSEIGRLECDQLYVENEFIRYAGAGFVLKNTYSSKRSLTGRAALDRYTEELVHFDGRNHNLKAKKVFGGKLKKIQDDLHHFILSDTASPIRIMDENNARKYVSEDSISIGFIRKNGLAYLTARSGHFPFYNIKDHWVSGATGKELVIGEAPKDLLFNNQMPLLLDEFKMIRPNVVDIFLSPDQAFAIVLTTQQLIVIDVKTRKVAMAHNLNIDWKPEPYTANARHANGVVMAEWAVGDNLNNWLRLLK